MDARVHFWAFLLLVLLFFSFPPWLQCDNPTHESSSSGNQGVDVGNNLPRTDDPLLIHNTEHSYQEPGSDPSDSQTNEALAVDVEEDVESSLDSSAKQSSPEDINIGVNTETSNNTTSSSPQVELPEVQEKKDVVLSSVVDRPCFPEDQLSEEGNNKSDDNGKNKILFQSEDEMKENKDETLIEKDVLKQDGEVQSTEKEPTEEPKPPAEEDDMPPFDEWKKKKMAEMEQDRKQVLTASNGQDRGIGGGGQGSTSGQQRHFNLNQNSKNHASADCGAKILTSNPEARSVSAILMQNRDVYMLNPCSAKIWFTVELCEPLQIKQIEIANFELFSSTPKTLKVQISDRYQSRDWHYLGTFHAIDQRTLQSFTIQDQGGMFAKYLKVEMLDFFGSEHYCPLSIIRVFGTSMEEEIIQESESHGANGDEEGDDDLVPGEGLKKANLLDSALDAVNHVVKRAAKALLGSEDARPSDCTDNVTDKDLHDMRPCMPEEDPNITTSGHPVNKGCFPEVPHVPIVPVERDKLQKISHKEYLIELCDPCTYCHKCDYSEYFPICNYVKYMKAIYPITCKHFIAKQPISQNKKEKSKKDGSDVDDKDRQSSESMESPPIVIVTASQETSSSLTSVIQQSKTNQELTASVEAEIEKILVSKTDSDIDNVEKSICSEQHVIQTETIHSSDEVVIEPSVPLSVDTKQEVEPVKTKPLDDILVTKSEIIQSSLVDQSNIEVSPSVEADIPTIKPTPTVLIDNSAATASEMKTVPEETPPLPDVEKTFYAEKDAHELPLGEQSKSGVVLPTSKESIFMRLNNRIKDLEYNMSLSQQYLQELSQRYRKQMDEMQKNFNKTVGRLTDSSQIADEKDHKQQDTIENLETQLARLTKLVENVSLEMKDMQHQMIERHFFLMLVEVVSLSFLFLFCVTRQRRRVHDIAPNKPVITIDSHSKKKTKLKRRNSVDGSVGHKKLELGKLKKKHHDDENISITGDYSDLLIVKPTKSLSVVLKKTETKDIMKHPKKQKSKAKGRYRIGSSPSLDEIKPPHNGHLHHTSSNISSAGLLFGGHRATKDSLVLCNGGGQSHVPKLKKNGSFDRIEVLYEDTGAVNTMKPNNNSQLPLHKHRKGPSWKKDRTTFMF